MQRVQGSEAASCLIALRRLAEQSSGLRLVVLACSVIAAQNAASKESFCDKSFVEGYIASRIRCICRCLLAQGCCDDAMLLLKQCRQLQETSLGEHHPVYATTLGDIAEGLK